MKQAGILGFGLAALLAAGCSKDLPGKRSPIMVAVQPVELLTPQPLAARYSASILPDRQIPVAFKVGGYVDDILRIGGRLAQEGDNVTKGQVLASLRSADYNARRVQAEAQLAAAARTIQTAAAQQSEAEAGLAKAQADFERAGALYGSKSLTRPEYDAAKAQLDMAAARVEAARAQAGAAGENRRAAEAVLQQAQFTLEDTRLVCPGNGIVVSRSIEIGTLAAPGMAGFVVAEIGTVKAVFGVPDTGLESVRLGMPISVRVEALPDQPMNGRVTAISPVTDPKTRVFSVEVSLANPKRQLKPGMIVSVSLSGETAPPRAFPVVPLSAVLRSKTDPNAFAVGVLDGAGESGTVHFRQVKLGDIFGNQVAVPEGLRAGERIVVSGAQQVLDGESVQVLP